MSLTAHNILNYDVPSFDGKYSFSSLFLTVKNWSFMVFVQEIIYLSFKQNYIFRNRVIIFNNFLLGLCLSLSQYLIVDSSTFNNPANFS